MNVRFLIVLTYLVMTLGIGLVFRKRAARSREEFFLAGRGVTSLLLFFTMAATNFSAFTIFGLSGAGYRMGYAFYPVMGFGTGFMALSFYLIGSRILALSGRRGYITPSDFISDRYGSTGLKRLFSLVMIVFTLPYIAIQAIASGRSLQALVGLPYLAGAALITGFVLVYVTLGGLRSIMWTDVVQGLMMIVFTTVVFAIVARAGGGFVRIHTRIAAETPELLSRPGLDGSMTMGVWFGYLFLWFFADPMFPQLFQRFMSAKDQRSLNATIVLYPLVTTLLFFLTVSIGVMGRHLIPGLPAGESDTIFALLLQRYTGVFVSTLLLTGSLAALMSTMDSQLLTLTSMITLDFSRRRRTAGGPGLLVHRLTLVLLALAGLLIAIRPPATILDFIGKTTFNGLAVLAPTVIGGLYWRRANRYGACASIIAGELLVVAFYFRWIELPSALPAVLPVVPILIGTGAVFALVSLLAETLGASTTGENHTVVFALDRSQRRWGLVFLLFFVAALDFWNWGRRATLLAGLPLWVWYYILLGLGLSVMYRVFLKRQKPAVSATSSR